MRVGVKQKWLQKQKSTEKFTKKNQSDKKMY